MAALLSSRTAITSTPRLVPARRSSRLSARSTVRVQAASEYQWIKKDPTVLVAGFLGWVVPSNIPVPAFGGSSLFGLFMGSIGENLAKFPTGPALNDKFFLYLITWHVGLFVAMTLGQIGAQARKQGYFD